MVVLQNGWFRRENPIYKNGRFRGTTILGNLHFYWHRIGVNFWLHRICIVEQQGPSTKHTSALRCAISCDELVRWIWGLWVLAFWVWWWKHLEAAFGGEVVGSTPNAWNVRDAGPTAPMIPDNSSLKFFEEHVVKKNRVETRNNAISCEIEVTPYQSVHSSLQLQFLKSGWNH